MASVIEPENHAHVVEGEAAAFEKPVVEGTEGRLVAGQDRLEQRGRFGVFTADGLFQQDGESASDIGPSHCQRPSRRTS